MKYILPEKLLDCQKKNILPDSGGLQSPSSYAYGYVMSSVWLGMLVMRRNWCLRVWSLVSPPVCCAVVKVRGARGGSALLLRLGPPLLESEPSQWTVTKHTVFTNWC